MEYFPTIGRSGIGHSRAVKFVSHTLFTKHSKTLWRSRVDLAIICVAKKKHTILVCVFDRKYNSLLSNPVTACLHEMLSILLNILSVCRC